MPVKKKICLTLKRLSHKIGLIACGVTGESITRRWTSDSFQAISFFMAFLIFQNLQKYGERLRLSLLTGQPFCKRLESLSNFLCQLLQRLINSFLQKITGSWQQSDKYVHLQKIASTLWGICLWVASTLRHLIIDLPEGCQEPLTDLQGATFLQFLWRKLHSSWSLETVP